MPKPSSAFPEHSVEAVWEAEMPSKAEPLRTACVPGIPKCLPPHIPCYLPWYEMFNKQVVCLLVNSWKVFLNACWMQTLYQSLRIWREKADYLPEFLYRMYRRSTANCFPAHWCSVCLLTLVSELHMLSDYTIVIICLGQSLPQGTYSEYLFVRGGR